MLAVSTQERTEANTEKHVFLERTISVYVCVHIVLLNLSHDSKFN